MIRRLFGLVTLLSLPLTGFFAWLAFSGKCSWGWSLHILLAGVLASLLRDLLWLHSDSETLEKQATQKTLQ